MREIRIRKADGEEEVFDPEKLLRSLVRAGASPRAQKYVVDHVVAELKDGATTSDIYRHAFDILSKQEEQPVAARYSLKRAVFDLGPSGFPLERFFAAVLRAEGWSTQVGVEMVGKCAPHEVDVLAVRGEKRIGCEVKFHNSPGLKTDLKDALYVHARFEDLKQASESKHRVDEGQLITNTHFTTNARQYGECVGLTMVGWEYPNENGMRARIERAGVHPLTCLTTLSSGEKKRLLDKQIVLCRQVQTGSHLLEENGVSPKKIPGVLSEASNLCVPWDA